MIDYFLTSIVILLVGLAFNVYPPSKLHGKYGYRSKAALKSKESWELAQRLARVYLVICGVVSLTISIMLYLFGQSNSARMLSVILPIGILLLVIFAIERKLRRL